MYFSISYIFHSKVKKKIWIFFRIFFFIFCWHPWKYRGRFAISTVGNAIVCTLNSKLPRRVVTKCYLFDVLFVLRLISRKVGVSKIICLKTILPLHHLQSSSQIDQRYAKVRERWNFARELQVESPAVTVIEKWARGEIFWARVKWNAVKVKWTGIDSYRDSIAGFERNTMSAEFGGRK